MTFITAKQINTWRSDVYKHFRSPPEIKIADGKTTYIFICLKSGEQISRAADDVSTGNLKRHIKRCEPATSKGIQMLESFATGSTYTPAKLRHKIEKWIIMHYHAFSVVEQQGFKEILFLFNPNVSIPSAITISRDIQDHFVAAKAKVIQFLKVSIYLF